MHICIYCQKRLSLGRTPFGWLGCAVCQRSVDEGMENWVQQRFGVVKHYVRRSKMELWERKQLQEVRDERAAHLYPIIQLVGQARVIFPIFREFVKRNPNKTLGELANELQSSQRTHTG